MVELIMIFILVASVFFGIIAMGEGGLKEALGVIGLLVVYTALYLGFISGFFYLLFEAIGFN